MLDGASESPAYLWVSATDLCEPRQSVDDTKSGKKCISMFRAIDDVVCTNAAPYRLARANRPTATSPTTTIITAPGLASAKFSKLA